MVDFWLKGTCMYVYVKCSQGNISAPRRPLESVPFSERFVTLALHKSQNE